MKQYDFAKRAIVAAIMLVMVTLLAVTPLFAADEVDIRKAAVIYITYETPNKNFLSKEHKPILSSDMYEIVFLGDGGTPEKPQFPSVPHFYKTATNGKLQIEPAKDSQGRGPIIEVVVPDKWAVSWDLYTNSSDPVRGSRAWNSFVNDVVMPEACKKFNFYEFASTKKSYSGKTYANVEKKDLSIALVVSGYATATDQDYVWTTSNIDGGTGAPSIWGNSGSARYANPASYLIPKGAKSAVSPDFNVEDMPLAIAGAFVTPSAATSPSDGHFYSPRGFGVYAHEMGHSAFGFVDVYDVVGYYRVQGGYPDPVNYPMRAALGNWSIMATGGYIYYKHDKAPASEFLRKYYNPESGAEPLNFSPGLLDAYNMVEKAGAVPMALTDDDGNLLPEYDGKTITMKLGDVAELRTSDPNQYFLLQVRLDQEYDKAAFQWGRRYARTADKAIDGGLLIMHVDKGFKDNSGSRAQDYPLSRPYVVKEAHGGLQDMTVRRIYDRSGDEDRYNFGDPGDLFGRRVHDFGPNTAPSNRLFYSNVMSADLHAKDPALDAGYDPDRQVKNFGVSSNWHMSEIKYDAVSKTVSFKVSSAIPSQKIADKVAKPDISETKLSEAAQLLGGLEIVLADPEMAYKTGLSYIDVTSDAAYGVKGAVDGAEVRANVGEANGLFAILSLKVKDEKGYRLIKVFDTENSIDITTSFPEFKPQISDGAVKLPVIIVDGAAPDRPGIIYAANKGYGLEVMQVDGVDTLVVYDGVKNGEANDPIFAVNEDGHQNSSGSGCNAGYLFGILAVAGIPLILKNKK